MTRDVIVVIDGGWDLLVFFEPLSKSSGGFYILLITLHSITFFSIDDPTLFQHWILVLGGHQEVFDGDTSSEVYLYPMFVASTQFTWYPSWAINRVKMKMKKPAQKKENTSNNNNQANCQKPLYGCTLLSRT